MCLMCVTEITQFAGLFSMFHATQIMSGEKK